MKEHLKHIVTYLNKNSASRHSGFYLRLFTFLFVFLFSCKFQAQTILSDKDITIIGDAIMVVSHDDGKTEVFSADKTPKLTKSGASKTKKEKKPKPAFAFKKRVLPEKIAKSIQKKNEGLLHDGFLPLDKNTAHFSNSTPGKNAANDPVNTYSKGELAQKSDFIRIFQLPRSDDYSFKNPSEIFCFVGFHLQVRPPPALTI